MHRFGSISVQRFLFRESSINKRRRKQKFLLFSFVFKYIFHLGVYINEIVHGVFSLLCVAVYVISSLYILTNILNVTKKDQNTLVYRFKNNVILYLLHASE